MRPDGRGGVPWHEARCDPTGLAPDPRITPGAFHRSPPPPEQFVDDSPLEERRFELLVPQSILLGGVNAGRHGGISVMFVFDPHLA